MGASTPQSWHEREAGLVRVAKEEVEAGGKLRSAAMEVRAGRGRGLVYP